MIRQIMTLATLCWMMAGCADEVLRRDGAEGQGRLLLSGIEVEAVVGDVLTKASLAEGAIPAASDFTITIVSAATGETVKTLQPGVEAGCFLPTGEYRVRASYGEEAGMSAVPYFYGESGKVTITAGEVKSVSLTASLMSAVIHPQMADKLVGQYNFYTLTVSETGGSGATLSHTLTNGEDFFVSGGKGKTYNLILAGQNKLGESVSHTWSYSDLVRRIRYIVQCDPDLPSFTLPAQSDGDAWSKFVYITPMTAKDIAYKPEGLTDEEILLNAKYEVSADGSNWIQAVKKADKWIVEGLNPSTTYFLRSNFFEVYSNSLQVMTESAFPVPNGDFEELKETVNISGMNQGGRWRATALGSYYQNTCNFTINEPSNWASVNVKTCNTNSSNRNSWFVIPSTYNTTLSWTGIVPSYGIWGGGGSETPGVYQNLSAQNKANAMVIRNVAWDANGTSPSDDSKTTGSSGYYNRNVPTIANRSAGKLFLGSYSYVNGIESYNEGVGFESRPLILKGYYKYVQDGNDNSETGIVTISLLNGNTIIGTASKALTSVSDYTEFEVPIVYSDYSLKATRLSIMITSSNHASYNQSEETSSIKTTNYNGRYESASRGAMLTIDNLTFSYEQ
ncbi:MAG: DUF4493 domain-containing protein [Parabacteroides sp.]|nr:DUF4493 domain-containing protein [Parabacteroides sp.]